MQISIIIWRPFSWEVVLERRPKGDAGIWGRERETAGLYRLCSEDQRMEASMTAVGRLGKGWWDVCSSSGPEMSAKYAVESLGLELRGEVWAERAITIQVVPEVVRLGGVTQGVSVAREKKALKNWVLGQVESSETAGDCSHWRSGEAAGDAGSKLGKCGISEAKSRQCFKGERMMNSARCYSYVRTIGAEKWAFTVCSRSLHGGWRPEPQHMEAVSSRNTLLCTKSCSSVAAPQQKYVRIFAKIRV